MVTFVGNGGCRVIGLISRLFSAQLPRLQDPVGAGAPAKQAPRCMAPAAPVFAGLSAPTGGFAAVEVSVRAGLRGRGSAV
ncbi:hypothetical protein DZC31_04460 [Stenotrophomonas rhizophila]|nr:hypothetical protein DZC31_04460 [Stenotrophomonas rhizophila]